MPGWNSEIAERQRVNVELRSAKERAEEAARLKSEFLANMSHEIRTPMNGVAGMISLVLDRARNPEDREQLLVAQNAAQALVTILNDILDLSKIEAGKMTLEAIAFDLPSMARDCLRIFEFAMREKQLDLRLDLAPGCPVWVRADPVRLRQVLLNLVGNAVKFTAAGSVTVDPRAARRRHDPLRGARYRNRHRGGQTRIRFSTPSRRPMGRTHGSSAAPGSG